MKKTRARSVARCVTLLIATALATMFAVGALGGPATSVAEAQDFDACDSELAGDDSRCDVDLEWECDGTIRPSASGRFSSGDNQNASPPDVLITTVVASRTGPDVYTFEGSTPVTFDGEEFRWSYGPTAVFEPVAAPQGSYFVTVTARGLDADGVPFDTELTHPTTGAVGRDIDTDCIEDLSVSCSAVSVTLVDRSQSDTYPPKLLTIFLEVGNVGGSEIAVIAETNNQATYSFSLDTPGIYYYDVYEGVDTRPASASFDDAPFGAKEDFRGSVDREHTTKEAGVPKRGVAATAAAVPAQDNSNRIFYTGGTFACLQPTVMCVNGLVTLATSAGDATSFAIEQTSELVSAITVNGDVEPDPGSAWPEWTYTFQTRPDEIVFDDATHELAHLGLFDTPPVPVCIYDISHACDTNGDWIISQNPDDRLPVDTVVSNDNLTYIVRGAQGSDNGVRFLIDGVLVRDVTFVERDCRTNVSIECVDGVPVVHIDPLDAAPDAFTNFTLNGTDVGAGGTFEIANRVDAVITSEPPTANVMLDAPQIGDQQNVTTRTLGGSQIARAEIAAGIDCVVEASVICAADGDDPRSRPQIIVDTTGTLLVNADGLSTNTIWTADPPPTDPQPGSLSTLIVGRPNEGPPLDNGVIWASSGERTRQIMFPNCQIGFEIVCGIDIIDDGAVPNGQTLVNYPGIDLTPAGTTAAPADGADVTEFAGGTITLSVDNGVQFDGLSSNTVDVFVDDCEVNVGATVYCMDGWPYADFNITPFGEFVVTNGTEADYDDGYYGEGYDDGYYDEEMYYGGPSLSYRWDDPYQGPDMLPQVMTLEVFTDLDNVLVSPNNPFSVVPYTCRIDAEVACGVADGGPTGEATFTTDLTNTPPGTTVVDDQDQTVMSGQTLDAGSVLTVSATNGVQFNTSGETGVAAQLTFDVPYCTITIEYDTLCIAGEPHAMVTVSEGEYELSVENGEAVGEGEGDDDYYEVADAAAPLSVDGLYRFTGDPMTITLDVQTTNALVLPNNPVLVARPVCVIDITIDCVAGTAVVMADTTDTPDTTVTPTPGVPVPQGKSTVVAATNGVYLRHNGSESLGAEITVTSPACMLSAELVCATDEGGPTGQATLRSTIPLLSPRDTEITPGAGTTTGSESTLRVSVNNGLHFVSSNAATVDLVAPACIVTATATAVCANGSIEITVVTAGAVAAEIVVNGMSYPAAGGTESTTTLDGFAPLDAYVISLVAADPANVAVGATETIAIDDQAKCRIELTATVQCLSTSEVLVTISATESSTGTLQTVAVNGDTNLPFLVAPGSSATVSATSTDTLPEDITVPTVVVPTSCDRSAIPLGGTLYVNYSAACEANGQDVRVDVTTEGSAGIIAMSVNGDPVAPYLVAPGETIVVSILTFIGNDAVVIDGPAIAPVCVAPTTPTPTPTPTLPPAIIVTFIPDVPTPDPTPEPTPDSSPDPTPEPTAEPTPEPTPESTPEPTPESTPEPTPEPGPEPTPEPDEVLSLSTSLRQHGRTVILLPDACDVDDISLPGAVRLVRDGVEDDGRIRFVAETATLDVGTYTETISCAGQQIVVVLFVYRQIGGARGEAASISRLALAGGVLTLVLVGVPGLMVRREEEVDIA